MALADFNKNCAQLKETLGIGKQPLLSNFCSNNKNISFAYRQE